MYGSYGLYSSMGSMTQPLAIPYNIQNHASSCAFPSWPRRSSLSESEHEEPRATSYLSDDDLFLSNPFADDTHSLSSASSSSSPLTAPINSPARGTDQEFLRRECERVAMQKEFFRQVKIEKERRRQIALKARKSCPKKSPKNKQVPLTTITESGE